MTPRGLPIALAALGLTACALGRPIEQRTTQGPGALDLWAYGMALANGRPPTFDERAQWESDLDERIARHLREDPQAASALDVSTFRFHRRVAVGMSKAQVLILLGPPVAMTTDAGEMAKAARRFWPAIQGRATEAWAYPLGWRLYFAGPRLVDITQYLEP
jgi:hypothetical protein